MNLLRSPGRVHLLIPVALLLAVSASSARPLGEGAGGAATTGWERKLDPFLRRLALGTRRVQGRFVDAVPALSAQAARALPGFVLAERSGTPVVRVKAGILDDASGSRRDREALRRMLSGAGIEIRGEAGPILSLSVPAAAIEPLARLPEI